MQKKTCLSCDVVGWRTVVEGSSLKPHSPGATSLRISVNALIFNPISRVLIVAEVDCMKMM